MNWNGKIVALANAVYRNTPKVMSYGTWQSDGKILLTTTPALVTGFVETISPYGASYSSGVFTIISSGLYNIVVERIYENWDTNPTSPINLTIDIKINNTTRFTRTQGISTATANDEVALATFCTPMLVELLAGDEISIYVSADMGGSNPVEAYLEILRISGHKIYEI